jgi:hypothetical protein
MCAPAPACPAPQWVGAVLSLKSAPVPSQTTDSESSEGCEGNLGWLLGGGGSTACGPTEIGQILDRQKKRVTASSTGVGDGWAPWSKVKSPHSSVLLEGAQEVIRVLMD